MKKSFGKILVGFVVLNLIFWPTISTQSQVATTTLSYLKSQPAEAWVTMALSALGETNLNLDYLKEVSGTQATDYEKTILALVAAKANPHTFGNIDYVTKLKSFYSSSQIGQENLLNDDIWGIIALSAAGEEKNSTEINGAKNFLLTNQNQDGGWGYGVGTASDTNDTAAAIMALLETDINKEDAVIVKAINYLKSQQNDDGGFPYISGSESDSGSDAWIISAVYKLEQNPLAWTKNNKNPIEHLKSLETSNGAFLWIASNPTTYTAMTAFAAIALAEKFYPVAKSTQSLVKLRIEGKTQTLCQTELQAQTALEIIKKAASVCNYSYEIKETSFGPYLSKINEEEAAGMSGWLYLVNNTAALVGANDYYLKEGDEVIWYYGDWGWQPLRLSTNKEQIDKGQSVEILVEYFDNSNWLPLAGAEIKIKDKSYFTETNGKLILTLVEGSYQLRAEKNGFIRSNSVYLLVGGKTKNTSLEVEVEQGQVLGEETGNEQSQNQNSIAFEINKSSLNFGKLHPGQEALNQLKISNQGMKISLETKVTGDNLFLNNLKLDNQKWSDFETQIESGQEKEIGVSFKIPADYLGSGIKTGQLIFWASSSEN